MARSISAAAIALVRHRRGLSARALSERAGLSPAYVCRFEKEGLEPSLRAFSRMALAAGLTPDEVWVCIVSEALADARVASEPVSRG